MHGFDEAAGDREPEPGARAYLIAFFHPIELVEDLLQFRGRDAVALIQDLQEHRTLIAPALNADGSALGRILAALSSRLNSACSNSTASRSSIGSPGSRPSSTPWP